MNSRPDAWLLQANNDLAFAQLDKDNDFLAQSCFDAPQAAANGLKGALPELGIEPTPHPRAQRSGATLGGITASRPSN